MYKKIELNNRISFLELKSLLELVPSKHEINWYLEDVEASGDLSSLDTDFESLSKEIEFGKYGKKVDLEYLLKFLESLDSLDSIMIFAGAINADSIDFLDIETIYNNVDYVFEFFDSTVWNFTSKDEGFINNVRNKIVNFNTENSAWI